MGSYIKYQDLIGDINLGSCTRYQDLIGGYLGDINRGSLVSRGLCMGGAVSDKIPTEFLGKDNLLDLVLFVVLSGGSLDFFLLLMKYLLTEMKNT